MRHRRWIFETAPTRIELRLAFDLEPGDEARLVPADIAIALLRRRDPNDPATLLRYVDVLGAVGPVPRLDHATWRDLAPALERALRRGALLALKAPRMESVHVIEDMERVERPSEERTWIEIEVVFDTGAPARGVRYEIALPDGQVRTGWTDPEGIARLVGIPAGSCQISFPDLDASDWKSA
jgi:hypothetical protein